MLRKAVQLICQLGRLKSVSGAIVKFSKSYRKSVPRVICQILSSPSGKYRFTAKVEIKDDFESLSELVTIYEKAGFISQSTAFDELTSQVLRASKTHAAAFIFLGQNNKCQYFDRESKAWIDYPPTTFICSKCNSQVQHSGLNAMDFDGLIMVCKYCQGDMHQKTTS